VYKRQILHDEVRRGWWDGALVNEFDRLLKESPQAWAEQPAVPVLGFSYSSIHRNRDCATTSKEPREAVITSSAKNV